MTQTPPQHATGRLLLIPLAALVAMHPLAVHGCSCGHDFDFHLVNWLEAAKQFSQGNLHPHWAFSPAYDAGEPRFVFYPPLSWMLGALLGLLLIHLPGVAPAAGWNAAPMLFTWIALTLSGVTFYRLAREFAGTNAALLAGILYLANPYMLFTAFERTAYAELLAAAWIPLLLLAILRARVSIAGIAVPMTLLWLTNAPAAIMGSYTLALLATIRFIAELRAGGDATVAQQHSHYRSALQLALKASAGAALGLGLAGFYIVPAIYQRRFVQIAMATIAGMSIDENFLFEHTGSSSDALLHDQVLHTASLIAVVLLVATIVALAAASVRRSRRGTSEDAQQGQRESHVVFPVLPLAILTAGIALLLTPLSAAIWKHTPEAAFLQFPWRLLAILAAVFALSFAVAISRARLTSAATAVGGVGLALALALPAYHLFRQPCDPEDTAPAQYAQFQSHAGTDPTDEYTPVAADNDALKQSDPPFWLAPNSAAIAPAAAQPGLAPMQLTIAALHPEFLILNLREYPAWRIFLDGALNPTREQRDDGLIALPIPAGSSTIEIRYAETRDEVLGGGLSLLALVLLLWLLTAARPQSAFRKHSVR